MADEKVTLLVDVEVDNQQAQTNLEETTRRVEILKKERTKLNAEIKKGNGVTKAQAQALTSVNQALKREAEEQKKYNKQVNTTSNSLNAMRLRLIENKKALGEIDQSTRKGAISFKKLSKETDNLNKRILKQEKGYGVATRNVGNYTSATEGLSSVFPQLGGGLAKVTQVMKAFTLSLLVNPVFLIISAIVALGFALSQFFTRSQKGVEKWERIQAVFNQTLDIMLDRFALIGEAVFEFIELISKDPLKALKKFGDAITENMVNRFIGFLDLLKSGGIIIGNAFLIMANKIKLHFADVPILGKAIDVKKTEKRIKELTKESEEAFESMGESAVQSVTGVDNLFTKVKKTIKGVNDELDEELKLIDKLTLKKQGLAKEEVQFIITNQRRLKQIARLRLEAEEESRSVEDRIKALTKAQQLEDANLQQQIKFKERAIALDLINNSNINTQQEAISRINQLLANGRDIKIEELGLNTSTLEDQKKVFESIAELDQLRESSFNKQKLLESKLTSLRRKGESERAKIENESKSRDQARAKELQKATEQALREFEIEQQASEKLRVFREQQRINEIENDNERLLAQQTLILSEADFKIQTEQLTQDQITLIREQAAAKNTELEERKAKAEEQLAETQRQNQINQASSTLGTLAGLFEEHTTAYKVFASAQAIIDTYTAANAAYSAMAGIPVAGPVLAPAAAGVAVAAGLANVAKINGVQFEQGGDLANTGGVLQGNSHANGGIPMTIAGVGGFEAEGKEGIINKNSMADPYLRSVASWVNTQGGGVAFARGGDLSNVSTATRSTNQIDSNAIQSREMMRAIQSIEIAVGVDEISRVSNNVAVKENLSLG